MFSRIINSFTSRNTDTSTDFLAAVKANNISLVKACIKRNPSLIHATDPKGRTGLFTASRYGCLQIADFLLANGARVNQASTNDGITSLMIAAVEGHKDIVELLLNHDANVNQATMHQGITPLFWAAQNDHKDIVELLLNRSANVNQATMDNDTTPLFIATRNGHKDIVELLLNRGAKLEQARTNDGATPLYIAAQNGHKDVVEQLLNRGANANQAATDKGATPLFVAAQNGHKDIVELLLDRGANVNQAGTNRGATPLFVAAHNDHKDIVGLLLDHDADTNLAWTDYRGRKITAYEQAIIKKHVEIVAMIRKKMAPSFSDRLEAIEYDQSIPNDFLDPISHEIINNPVTVSSGITYDRDSLAKWFEQNNNPDTLPCPTTKFIIHRRELEHRANVIMKSGIEAFVTEKENESKAEKAIPSMRALSACGMMQFSSSSHAPTADGAVGRVQLKS